MGVTDFCMSPDSHDELIDGEHPACGCDAVPDDIRYARQIEEDWARAAFLAADGPIGGEG